MASRDIVEAAGVGDQPPCVAGGLFFTEADVVVDDEPVSKIDKKRGGCTVVHKVLNGPAKFRERNFHSDGTLQEEFYYNVDTYRRIWKHREWYSNGILARVCGYNYNSRYHGHFMTFYDNGFLKTNQMFNEGRRIYDLDLWNYDDQVYIACAASKEIKKLKGMFNGPSSADDNTVVEDTAI
jgi:antitoxin component YwqK of YwqJK toxin-antitoxin module